MMWETHCEANYAGGWGNLKEEKRREREMVGGESEEMLSLFVAPIHEEIRRAWKRPGAVPKHPNTISSYPFISILISST